MRSFSLVAFSLDRRSQPPLRTDPVWTIWLPPMLVLAFVPVALIEMTPAWIKLCSSDLPLRISSSLD